MTTQAIEVRQITKRTNYTNLEEGAEPEQDYQIPGFDGDPLDGFLSIRKEEK